MTHLSSGELEAAKVAARKAVDDTGYGNWVSDDVLTDIVAKALRAAEEYRQQQKQR